MGKQYPTREVLAITNKDRPEIRSIKDQDLKEVLQLYLSYFDWYTNKEELFNDEYTCCICGLKANKRYKVKYYCTRHLAHMYKFGEVQAFTRRTPNELIVKGDIIKIVIQNMKGELQEATIDLESIPLIIDYKWYMTELGYIKTNISKGKHKFMHRVLMGLTNKEEILVDHIDGNPSNNIKSNLRLTSPKGNAQNKHDISKNILGFKGVRVNKLVGNKESYTAYIKLDNKFKTLGTSTRLKEIIRIRLQAEKDLFEEGFAPQRHLFKKYGIFEKSINYEQKYSYVLLAQVTKSSIKEKHIRKSNNSYIVYKSDKTGYVHLATFKLLEDAIYFRDVYFNT